MRVRRKTWNAIKIALVFVAISFLPKLASCTQVKETRRVLVFYEAGLSFPDIAIVDQEIRKALDKSPYQIELYTENMEEVLFPEESSQQEFRDWYIHKYRNHKPDLIIAEGPPSIKFMVEDHQRFFPGTPVVFCCGPHGQSEELHLDSSFTGAWMEVGPAATLEAALQLQPRTRHVVVVGGVSSVDRNIENITREALQKYERSLDFTYLTNLELPALLERLKRLPDSTIILYTSLAQDAAGTSFIDTKESIPMIVRVSNAPVFVMSETFLGSGAVGGSVTSFGAQGRIVGETATRILRGEKPQNIPIAKSANLYEFDWTALRRWGLKAGDLPAGSIVLNREPNLWERYWKYIVAGLAVIVVQFLLIMGLLWQRARRRKTEAELRQSQSRLEGIVESAMDAVIAIDAEQRIVVFNDTAEKIFGCPAEKAIGSHIGRFVPERFRAAHREHLRRFGETGGTTRTLGSKGQLWGLRADGEEFPIEASISKTEAGGRKLFTAIIRDVTERKRAEENLLYRLEFESLISDLSATYINLPEEQVDVNMEQSFARLGDFLKMDRISLFEFSQDHSQMTMIYSWNGPGVMPAPTVVDTADLPWWRGRLMRGEEAFTLERDSLPEEASAEREYFLQTGIVSAASIPLRVGGEINGAMSFVTVHHRVSWTEDLLSQLRVIGDIFWNALRRKRAVEALVAAQGILRESEERFRLVSNTAPVMIWMARIDKLCAYFNEPWLQFTGRSFKAELGNGWVEGVHPDDLQQCFETYSDSFDRREPFHMEYRLRHHDGEYRWILDTGVPRFNADGSFAGYIGSAIDVTERKQAEAVLSSLSGKLIEAQEQERIRIARELHDDISQQLALLSVEISQAKSSLKGSPTITKERLEEVGRHCIEIAEDIHSLSHQLHSSKLDHLGMVPAIRGFCQEFAKQQHVSVEFHDENVPTYLPQNVSLCLFRVTQEALHNAVKYSGTNQFAVRLIAAGNEIELTVRDNGAGFDVEEAKRNRGLGLVSMQERIHLVNGRFSVESRPGEGTRVVASVPIAVSSKEQESNGRASVAGAA